MVFLNQLLFLLDEGVRVEIYKNDKLFYTGEGRKFNKYETFPRVLKIIPKHTSRENFLEIIIE